ncbi:MAG: SGNH/GDSL hydrolase family protein [Deltaproteobacteria bacterium]|nr:SGNH/GDSL hydrolase family protein [Deltaproteobacteria bacterium]
MWWWAAATWAGSPVVALGDAGPAGGWVPVLADCLEERSPGNFSVVDRAAVGETVGSVGKRAAGVRELGPAAIVLSLRVEEATPPAAFRKDLSRVLRDLRGPDTRIVLVGIAPPTAASEVLAAEWNAQLAALARSEPDVQHADLLADWPKDEPGRAALSSATWTLSDQGHARVAAAVCDVLLREKAPR